MQQEKIPLRQTERETKATKKDMEEALSAALKELFVGKVMQDEEGIVFRLVNGQQFRFKAEEI